jgi:peptidoglycan/xylan/chitin deacetylase (PgdA/CDA1 family)
MASNVLAPGLLIVNFHHVRAGNPAQLSGLHHRTPVELRTQVELLAQNFEFPGPQQVLDWIQHPQRRSPDDRLCLLSFDDGLKDHYEHVFPLLEKMKIKGVFSVNTGPWVDNCLLSVHMAHLLSASFSYLELSDDFERAAHARKLRLSVSEVADADLAGKYRYDTRDVARVKFYLNAIIPQEMRAEVLEEVFRARLGPTEEYSRSHYAAPEMISEMNRAGHEIGLHSHQHVRLSAATPAAVLKDLQKNKTMLDDICERPARWIAYPYGDAASYDSTVLEISRSLGCKVGLTMVRGINRCDSIRPLEIRRCDTNDVIGGKRPIEWPDLAPR